MELKKVLNLHEEITDKRLQGVCEKHGARVFQKVRVADILPIENSGISNQLYQFGLQSHFDFLVTDLETTPLFAVEYDGPSHNSAKQKGRDEKKDRLCNYFNFPILRIDSSYLNKRYGDYDLLSWIVELYFIQESFHKAQSEGYIPLDEPFDPAAIMYTSAANTKETFPFWLSRQPRVKIEQLWDKKRILDPYPTYWIGLDETEQCYAGIAWLWIDKKYGVRTTLRIKRINFPVIHSFIIKEILIYQLYEEIMSVLDHKTEPKLIKEIDKQVKNFHGEYEWSGAGGIRLPSKYL